MSLYTCRTCGEDKPTSAFSIHLGCAGGIDTGRCKQCKSTYERMRRITNYDHVRYILHRCKARAKRNGIDFNLTLDDIKIPPVCPVYGTQFTVGDTDTTASVDRIDPAKGYIRGNIRIISNKANRLRNNATLDDLQRLVAWLQSCEVK